MSNAGEETKTQIDADADRLAGATSGAPETPMAFPHVPGPAPSIADRSPAIVLLAEQAANAVLDEHHNRVFAELQSSLESFKAIGHSAELDPAAFKALRTVYPGMLAPLADLLKYGTKVRSDMYELCGQRTQNIQAQEYLRRQLADQLAVVTRERDTLRGAAEGGAGAAVTSLPFHLSSAPGSGSSMMEASSATSATSVFIQGPAPKHVSAPINHPMIRDYRDSVKVAHREGRTVRHEVLISAAARAQISLKFWLLACEPGFCREFLHGARGAAKEAQLEQLASAPETWWMRWPDLELVDALIRAFPKETEGATAVSQTLEDLLGKITLKVSVSNQTPILTYLGEVHKARELAQPRVPRDEVQCVKTLHRVLGGPGADMATATFKEQLHKAFAGKLPATIDKYLLEVDRQFQIAARADALSRAYIGQRIGKGHQQHRDSNEPGGRGGGGGGGGGGGRYFDGRGDGAV
jgi:hypothetical protein